MLHQLPCHQQSSFCFAHLNSFQSNFNLPHGIFINRCIESAIEGIELNNKHFNKNVNKFINHYSSETAIEILNELIEICCYYENYEIAIRFRDTIELIK